ncbi:MAG: serine hydrolase, partial [Desulfobulbaceae bacterium]|nr:serine hydrolase [Desulfobulbaceae bacterium]
GVLTLCEHLLDQWQGREEVSSYADTLLKKILQRRYADQTWCLGFDTPSPSGSSGGRYLSANSVGHLGYTGTSFWIDPENEIIIVLLSNRVHPSRENKKIRKFRPIFNDTVVEFLQKEDLVSYS